MSESAVIAEGGKSVYGAEVGILMLDTRFPRIPGDVGNAGTWPFPVRHKVVRGASPDLVVRKGAPGLLEIFIAAGRELVAEGCGGVATGCGFLSLYQSELATALDVPVATSSLMQAPTVAALLPPGKRVGILTISAESMTARHLANAGVPADTPVWGTEGGREFTRAILDDEARMDVAAARADMVEAARAFQAAHPELGAILFECTNMAPYQRDVVETTGLPVFSIYDFICWFRNALAPRRFPL